MTQLAGFSTCFFIFFVKEFYAGYLINLKRKHSLRYFQLLRPKGQTDYVICFQNFSNIWKNTFNDYCNFYPYLLLARNLITVKDLLTSNISFTSFCTISCSMETTKYFFQPSVCVSYCKHVHSTWVRSRIPRRRTNHATCWAFAIPT